MKIYIDCDGVILDTETNLFDRYYELKEINPELSKREYITSLNWREWLYECGDINEALRKLKFYGPRAADILTKVYSYEEGKEKVIFFRENGVYNDIILVPGDLRKNDVVMAYDNILVDDNKSNLDSWNAVGGHAIYFGEQELVYPKIETLDEVLDPVKVKRLINKR